MTPIFAATLPALFFAAVMSENDKGDVFYGNDVYLRENRKNAKIKFPIECTPKMCQVTWILFHLYYEVVQLSIAFVLLPE